MKSFCRVEKQTNKQTKKRKKNYGFSFFKNKQRVTLVVKIIILQLEELVTPHFGGGIT